jgi:hypothetical protein
MAASASLACSSSTSTLPTPVSAAAHVSVLATAHGLVLLLRVPFTLRTTTVRRVMTTWACVWTSTYGWDSNGLARIVILL